MKSITNKKPLLIALGIVTLLVGCSVAHIAKKQQVSQAVPDFNSYTDVNQKKQAFFDFIRPHVQHENQIITEQRKELLDISKGFSGKTLSGSDLSDVQDIAQNYRYTPKQFGHKELKELLSRVDTIPENLVLIQAANESGWGTSRFARTANNFFGEWCFTKGCGVVPSRRASGKTHEVAKFDNVGDSVASYVKNLNTNSAYVHFRQIRAQVRAQHKEPTAEQLIHGLDNYSERADAYINDILAMLRHNKKFLTKS
ncbi:glucosaminidase domain-containing protein [Vibrio gallicus]|uniref:glucosaminidase domain-containing protein n=1 Tax=Vibrio gallicus TaxID=190897 RepID=UPI0021C3D3AA|nr:glucosaminidase domain-containing protein [Vibrio gallicus]